MLKNWFDAICGGRLFIDSENCPQKHVQDIMLCLAYSWTCDIVQARQLVNSVLADVKLMQSGSYPAHRLWIYANLFRRWCISPGCSPQMSQIYPEQISNMPDSIQLQQYVFKLPKFQRVVLTFVDIADLSYRDVACIINTDEQKVNAWITLARKSILQQSRLHSSVNQITVSA